MHSLNKPGAARSGDVIASRAPLAGPGLAAPAAARRAAAPVAPRQCLRWGHRAAAQAGRRVRPSAGRRRPWTVQLMKRPDEDCKSGWTMRSGLGPTVSVVEHFSIKASGAARPTCTSRRWRLSFRVLRCLSDDAEQPRSRASSSGFAGTAARASASLRTRAGARPRRPSFASRLQASPEGRRRSRRICSCESTSTKQAYVDLSVSVLPATATT